ncbi:MAG: hypothetical protein ACREQE_12365, partial [Candidatus Binataceae bacterium]
MKRWIQWLVVVIVAVGVYFGVRAFRVRALAPHVPTVAARRGTFTVTVSVRGSLTPLRSVQIHAPRISGLIIASLAPSGGLVKKGDIIATFDSGTAKDTQVTDLAALNQAKAQLAQIKAQAVITDQQDALSLATDENTVASAKLTVIKQSIMGAIAGDEAKLALQQDQEKLKVQKATMAAHRTSNQAKIATDQRAQQKAQADYDLITQQIAEMTVPAPITGRISY